MDDIPDSYIIIAACQDDCVTNMSDNVKTWFESLGSETIYKLGYRQGFVFIGKSFGIDFNEKIAQSEKEVVTITQIF